jgi:Ca2+-transporting ATPase
MTGDGVNDAPALKRADIGIVVGDATDVARETADLVLLDSNFATIIAAVEEGRAIFINIRKVMTYLLSDTFAEVTLILLGLIIGVPLPLTAAQILWINLVTDTLPTLALTFEPKEKHLLKRPPITSSLPILSKSIVAFMLIASFTSGIVIFALYWYLLTMTGDVATARLVAFTAFSIKSLVYVFSLRDRNRMIWQTSLFANRILLIAVAAGFAIQLIGLYLPITQKLLTTRALTPEQWFLVALSSLLILVTIEAAKYVRLRLKRLGYLSPPAENA